MRLNLNRLSECFNDWQEYRVTRTGDGRWRIDTTHALADVELVGIRMTRNAAIEFAKVHAKNRGMKPAILF